MKSKIIILLFILTCAHTTIAADKLLSMQQKYGFKLCQKMTPKIKKTSNLVCIPSAYQKYIDAGFYGCVLTNKKMGLNVMTERNKVSDITFNKIFDDTDYGYGIGGKNITPDLVKNQLAKHKIDWSEIHTKDGEMEVYFGKTYTHDFDSFVSASLNMNMVLIPKEVPEKRSLTASERKATKFYADFDGLCGDFSLGYSYRFDAKGVIKVIDFSSAVP